MFRTEIKIESSLLKINHESNILSLGSCFANMMAEKLLNNKFKVSSNPFGIIYNPISLFNLLNLPENTFSDQSFLQNENIWLNYHFHSDFYDYSKSGLKKKIIETKDALTNYIRKANFIILTLGTAFIYKQKDSECIVANCHKSHERNFIKELLSPSSIVNHFNEIIKYIHSINPNIQYIFTVSPVRHIKDTIPLNAVSKSILRIACHEIVERHSNAIYFPSYEIMMDDLRDYRFYKEDMIHPTEVAENYIWEKFASTFFSNETQKIIQKWQNLLKAIEHRPFHAESTAHQTFLKETLEKVKQLSIHFNVNEEISILEKRIKN